MNKHGRIILFTSEFPYGKGETFIEEELLYLTKEFPQVTIVTKAKDLSEKRKLPENIQVVLYNEELSLTQKLMALTCAFKKPFRDELQFCNKHFNKVIGRKMINTALVSLYRADRLESFLLKEFDESMRNPSTVLYSYWADDFAVGLAMLKAKGYVVKTVSRAHRWDVYYEKNGSGYLPFRKLLAERLDLYCFISENGKAYTSQLLKKEYPSMLVQRLGVQQIVSSMELVPLKNSLKILSCSSVIPRKQVAKIAEALMFIPDYVSVTWTHIGGGPLYEELEKQCSSITINKPNIKCVLLGSLTNTQVKTFYKTNSVDLFINVSESEGVPVSIMECMSVGVPALATDVDGNAEIVIHGVNGILVEKEVTPKVLADALIRFSELSSDARKLFSSNAQTTWEKGYFATKNYTAFAETLVSLTS